MTTTGDPYALANAVTAVSQALLQQYTPSEALEQRYLFVLEAALTHGIKETMSSMLFGHSRLFDMYNALVQSFPKAERPAAERIVAQARYLGNSSAGRGRILTRILLNTGDFASWLSCLRFDIGVLKRFYENWALLRMPGASAALGNAVDAVTRAVRFHIQVRDTMLNSEGYWDDYPEIVNMDLPLIAPPDARGAAPDGAEASPSSVQWTDVIYVQYCQALVAASVLSRRFTQSQLPAVRSAQALLRTQPPFHHSPQRVVEEVCRAQALLAMHSACRQDANFPRTRGAALLAQACVRQSQCATQQRAAEVCVCEAQALLRAVRAQRQHEAIVRATEHAGGLFAASHGEATAARAATAAAASVQALLVASACRRSYCATSEAAKTLQVLLDARAQAKSLAEHKRAAAETSNLLRAACERAQHRHDVQAGPMAAQALMRARSVPYKEVCHAATVSSALLGAAHAHKQLAAKREAAAVTQGLVAADQASSELRSAWLATLALQAIVRSNNDTMARLLRALAATWAQSGVVGSAAAACYHAQREASAQAQALLRARKPKQRIGELAAAARFCQDLLADARIHKQQRLDEQRALDRAKEEVMQQRRAGATSPALGAAGPSAPAAMRPPAQSPRALPTQRPQWMADSASSVCVLCKRPFTLTNRKHHCRNCGILVDDQCTERRPLPHFGYNKPVIVCRSCIVHYFT